MRCERAQPLYDEYSRGSLPVSTMARVEEHLAACPACREFYDQSDIIARLLRRTGEIAHPGQYYFEHLTDRVLSRLDGPEKDQVVNPAPVMNIPRTPLRRPLWWTSAAAAAALLALGFLPLDQWGQSEKKMFAARKANLENVMMAKAAPGKPSAVEGAQPTTAKAELAQAHATPIAAFLKLLDKSYQSRYSNSASVDGFISSPGGSDQQALSRQTDLQRGERRDTQNTEKELASLRPPLPKSMLPPDVFRRLETIENQLMEERYNAAARTLSNLEGLIAVQRNGDRLDFEARPAYRQAKLYLNAHDDLVDGRLETALITYRQILEADQKSRLAIKASLQLADLYYGQSANFSAALGHYQRCMGVDAAKVLSQTEKERVQRSLERLEQYKANNWQALDLLDRIHKREWPDVLAALRALVTIPSTSALMPEAAQTVRERLNNPQSPLIPSETMKEIYNLLEDYGQKEQNGEIRAWVELELGEMAFTQFPDSQLAGKHYSRAMAAAENSQAAEIARAKKAELEESLLKDPLRNWK